MHVLSERPARVSHAWAERIVSALATAKKGPAIVHDLPSAAVVELLGRFLNLHPRQGATREYADCNRNRLYEFLYRPGALAFLHTWHDWFVGISVHKSKLQDLRDADGCWRDALHVALATAALEGHAPPWMLDAACRCISSSVPGSLPAELSACLDWLAARKDVTEFDGRVLKAVAAMDERLRPASGCLPLPQFSAQKNATAQLADRLAWLEQVLEHCATATASTAALTADLGVPANTDALNRWADETLAARLAVSELGTAIEAQRTMTEKRADALAKPPRQSRRDRLRALTERIKPSLELKKSDREVLDQESAGLGSAKTDDDCPTIAPVLSAIAHLLGDEEPGLTAEGVEARLLDLTGRFVRDLRSGVYSIATASSLPVPAEMAHPPPVAPLLKAASPAPETSPLEVTLSPAQLPRQDDAANTQQVAVGETSVADGPAASIPLPEAVVPTPESLRPDIVQASSAEASPPSGLAPRTASSRRRSYKPPTPDASREADTDIKQAADCSALVDNLLADGELELAYHASRAAEVLGVPTLIPSALIHSAVAGLSLKTAYGPGAEEIQAASDALENVLLTLETDAEHVRDSKSLLLLAAVAKPTLLSPNAGRARDVLAALTFNGSVSWAHAIRLALQEIVGIQAGTGLNPAVLKGIAAADAWRTNLTASSRGCQAWLNRQPFTVTLYAAATKTWQALAAPEGELGKLMLLASTDEPDHAPQIRAALEEWVTEADIDKHIHRVDRALRGRLAERNPIQARALRTVRQHASAARVQLAEWCDLAMRKPPNDQFLVRRVLQLKPRLQQALAGTPALPALADQVTTVQRLAAMTRDSLAELFDPNIQDGAETSATSRIVGAALTLRGVALGPDGMPAQGTEQAVLAALANPDLGGGGLMSAFNARFDECNHDATRRILYMLRATLPQEELDVLERKRDRALRESRALLREAIDDCRARVTEAAASELLPQSVYLEAVARIDSIDASSVEDFATAHAILDKVKSTLQSARDRGLQAVKSRLSAEKIDPQASARVLWLLDRGDILGANECIDVVLRGDPLPQERPHLFDTFFPGFVEHWQRLTSGPTAATMADVHSRLKASDCTLFSPTHLTAEPQEAATALSKWLPLLRRSYRDDKQEEAVPRLVCAFLEQLGFSSPAIDEGKLLGADVWCGKASVTPIAGARTCPVPRFGSQARGRYRILVLWGTTRDEELQEHLSRLARDPLIVLHMGTVTVARRREIARMSRVNGFSFVLVDDALVAFLALQQERLSTLFTCSLPFSSLQPYVTKAGIVPDELFVGREDELRSVIDANGTNLVYGGRQLGKTALLRHAERKAHNPAEGLIVRWIDLKHEMVGTHRVLDDLWSVISTYLCNDIPQVQATTTRPEKLWLRLREWLDEEPSRRIVLLLDEADQFLAMDRNRQWATILILKGWMEQTDRRFKVVLAGLHDVQRTSRDVNTPLAHFGDPVCIGPLLKGPELQAALDLVERPLRALGYKFEGSQIALRLLAHANYYPSLIQLICRSLVEHLGSRTTFETAKTPPYVVTAAHLDDAYRADELRKQVLKSFRWTLDLDPRYRVLALLLAWETAQQREVGKLIDEGLSVRHLRDSVLAQWDGGFGTDSSLEAFRTILDEMIGLGLLRTVSPGCYALRSANVLNLFGTSEEIFDALMDAVRHPPREQEADPAQFRRAIHDPAGRSALTAKQESELLASESGVAVVFGCPLASLPRVPEHLRFAGSRARVEVVQNLPGPRVLEPALDRLWSNHQDGLLVAVVPADAPWSSESVADASRFVSRRNGSRRIRVIFLGDAEAAWRWTASDVPAACPIYTLRAWSQDTLHQWLDEDLKGNLPLADIESLTGLWPEPLRELRLALGEDSRTWADRVKRLRDGKWIASWIEKGTLPDPGLCVLRALGEWKDPVTPEDLADATAIEVEAVRRAMHWAELLGVARTLAHGTWKLDPFVAELILSGCAT